MTRTMKGQLHSAIKFFSRFTCSCMHAPPALGPATPALLGCQRDFTSPVLSRDKLFEFSEMQSFPGAWRW